MYLCGQWGSEEDLWESELSYHVRPNDQIRIQVFRLGGKWLYLLSHLSSPHYLFLLELRSSGLMASDITYRVVYPAPIICFLLR